MATSEVTNTSAMVRVHRRNVKQPCRNWACMRRHAWASACDCGWIKYYRKRWEAVRALRIFHWEEDHGGSDD